MKIGVDISRWDDDPNTVKEIDFNQMKMAGAEFVYFKATQAKFTDRVFQTSWADAKGILPRGCYCFLDWSVSGLEQAKYFCDVIKNDPGELPPVADFEYRVNVPTNAKDELWNWLTYVEQHTNKIPLIYTSPSYWVEFGSKHLAWTKYGLWIANYKVQQPVIPAPWKTYILWQFTDKGDGTLFGAESKSIDLNYFGGTETEFAQFCGNYVQPPLTIPQKVDLLYEQGKIHGWALP